MRVLIAIVLLIVLSSCEREDYQLQRQMDKLIAKESRRQIDSMKVLVDSLCIADFEKNVQEKVDSIVPARIEEIRKKLNPARQ